MYLVWNLHLGLGRNLYMALYVVLLFLTSPAPEAAKRYAVRDLSWMQPLVGDHWSRPGQPPEVAAASPPVIPAYQIYFDVTQTLSLQGAQALPLKLRFKDSLHFAQCTVTTWTK
jgi:hypothetical protein